MFAESLPQRLAQVARRLIVNLSTAISNPIPSARPFVFFFRPPMTWYITFLSVNGNHSFESMFWYAE